MAYVRGTRVSAYVEFDGGTRRAATSASIYVEFNGSDKVKTSAVTGYVETLPSSEWRATQVLGIAEEIPAGTIKSSTVVAYVEFLGDPGDDLISAPPVDDTDPDSAKVSNIIGIVGLQSRLALLSQLVMYAELVDSTLYVTKFINLVELSLDDLRVTKFVNLIELDYDPVSDKGLIIIGSYKTWRDHYPQNTTDIPPYQAYNFITSANSMYMIDLEWNDVEDEDGYEIERSDDGLTDWELIVTTDPDVTKYISISLEPNTTYYYRIRSFNEGGYSPYSDVVSETTKRIGPFIIGKSTTVNDQNQNIVISKPIEAETGDYMLMQIGTQDILDINYPDGWDLETVIHGAYDNAILSRTVIPGEPTSYTITRNSSTKPIVTVAIFAWDATEDNIIFYDG